MWALQQRLCGPRTSQVTGTVNQWRLCVRVELLRTTKAMQLVAQWSARHPQEQLLLRMLAITAMWLCLVGILPVRPFLHRRCLLGSLTTCMQMQLGVLTLSLFPAQPRMRRLRRFSTGRRQWTLLPVLLLLLVGTVVVFRAAALLESWLKTRQWRMPLLCAAQSITCTALVPQCSAILWKAAMRHLM